MPGDTDRRVLSTLYYVDDSDDEIFLSRVLFKRQKIDLEIVHFSTFQRFLEHSMELEPELLAGTLTVVDLNLTISKGTEGIRTFRGRPEGSRYVIGICSGSEDPADRQLAFDSGADFFVPKPLNRDRLSDICASRADLSLAEDAEGRLYVSRAFE